MFNHQEIYLVNRDTDEIHAFPIMSLEGILSKPVAPDLHSLLSLPVK